MFPIAIKLKDALGNFGDVEVCLHVFSFILRGGKHKNMTID